MRHIQKIIYNDDVVEKKNTSLLHLLHLGAGHDQVQDYPIRLVGRVAHCEMAQA